MHRHMCGAPGQEGRAVVSSPGFLGDSYEQGQALEPVDGGPCSLSADRRALPCPREML